MAGVDQDNLHMKFLALNANFSNPSLDPLGSRRPAQASVKEGSPLKSGYLCAVHLSSMEMVAYRHRHATEHNKHWQRAF